MTYEFLLLALIIAILDWIAVARKWKRIEYFAKPATMLALLAWVGINGGFQGTDALVCTRAALLAGGRCLPHATP